MTRKEQIEEFIKFHAHKFSVRNGYETIEELMREMAQWCDNNPKNPWISVEERLPENDVEVIGNTERGWKFLVKRNCGVWCGMEYRAHTSPKITHWMPISQIKKGE